MKFICDDNPGKLATYLRVLGYDTLFKSLLLVSDAPSDTEGVTDEDISYEPLVGQAHGHDQQWLFLGNLKVSAAISY